MTKTEIKFGLQTWVDIQGPTESELKEISNELGLPESMSESSLKPEHLPLLEVYGATQFLVFRLPEEKMPIEADTVQELTTKVVFFLTPKVVVSLHRQPSKSIVEARKLFEEVSESDHNPTTLLSIFLSQVAIQYQKEISDLDTRILTFEENIFEMKRSRKILKDGYYIKRKASAYRRILKLTIDVAQKFVLRSGCSNIFMQHSLELLQRGLFSAEDAYENVQSLLSLHMAIQSQKINEASYRTNEAVKVLTILTLFFLPLNFITGIFGMNFTTMPWIQSENGFYFTMMLMILLVGSLVSYLYVKGWLNNAGPSNSK